MALHAGQQDAFTAELLFQVLGAFLDGQAAGDLAHGSQQGQGAVLFLQGFIRHGVDLALQQGIGLLKIGGQVQIGVKDQAFPEEGIFAFQRFLDLDHHIHQVPDIRGVVDQGSARVHIFIVRESGAKACAFLDIHMMSCGNIGADVVRGQADPVFIVLDLFDTADLHLQSSFPLFRKSKLLCQ